MAMSTRELTAAIRAPFMSRFLGIKLSDTGFDHAFDNAYPMQWRNAADTANFSVLTVNSSNQTVLDGGTGVVLGSSITSPMILKTRTATSTAAGAAIAIDASWVYGEANEWRYTVSNWTGTGNQFQGLYLRNQSDADNASGGLRGAEITAVANASAASNLEGVFASAYVKGDAAKTVTTIYGGHSEFTMDAGRANSLTIGTEAVGHLVKVTNGKCADYTKIHGAVLRFGDMDGGSRTYGNGILIEDDAAMAGTATLTAGLKITAACTRDFVLQNGEYIDNATNGYITTDGALRTAGTGGAGAASTLTLAYAEVAAAGSTATMTNAPAAGNPAKWLAVWYGATKYVVPLFASA